MALNAGVTFGVVAVSFNDDAAARHSSYRLEMGLRVPAWRSGSLRQLRLTPKLGLHATHVTGMDPEKDTYAYSSLDLAVRGTYARWRLRPYLEARKGLTQTAERTDRLTRILNFTGGGNGFGMGLEFPIFPSSRGVEIGVTVLNGTFTAFEFEHDTYSANLRHRAVAVHVGWSGHFTGISLPWQ